MIMLVQLREQELIIKYYNILQRLETIFNNNKAGLKMQKKKQVKTGNKSLNISSKKQQKCKIPVEDIMKEIGQLKKELVSIKSKKYLKILQNNDEYLQGVVGNTKRQSVLTKTKSKPKLGHKLMQASNNQSIKQNIQRQQIGSQVQQTAKRDIYSKQLSFCQDGHKNTSIKPSLRVQLCNITGPKSRQIKLKVNIQLNKIKSVIQRIHGETKNSQTIQLLIAQINSTLTYLDSCFRQYQHQLSNKINDYKQMKTELSELTENTIRLAQKHSNQKNVSASQIEQISELKRHLSYYMYLIKQNKDEVTKNSKQIKDLEIYNKELQYNNEMLRKQIKSFETRQKQMENRLKDTQSQLQKKVKEILLLQSDLHSSGVELQKNKDKKRQLQKINQKITEQFKQLERKYNFKQYQLSKIQEENNQINKNIHTIKQQYKSLEIGLANKQLEHEKLQRQNTILRMNIQKKQQVIQSLDQQILEMKQKLQESIKQNKRLSQNVEFCQMQINNLSQQIDQLKKSNERYKNKHFRDKFIQNQSGNELQSSIKLEKNSLDDYQSNSKQNKRSTQLTPKKNDRSHSKNRKKILGQIQQIIQKHKRQSDGSSEDDQY